MNLLITGGAGFIGSNLIQHIIGKPEITRLVNLDALTYAGHPENLTAFSKHPKYAFEQVDLRDKDLWAQRQAWLLQNQPVMGEEGDTKAQILKVVSDGIRQNKLEKLDQGLGSDIEHGPAGEKVSVTVKVKGSTEGICRWLADLQKPANFYAVTISALQADDDMKSMTCSLQITRYFKTKEGS